MVAFIKNNERFGSYALFPKNSMTEGQILYLKVVAPLQEINNHNSACKI